MSLSRWMMLIAAMVGLGCLKISQRNAIILSGYGLGERMARAHAKETEISWMGTQVAWLASPAHLAEVAQDRRLKLVAWSALSSTGAAQPLTHLASIDADQRAAEGHDLSD